MSVSKIFIPNFVCVLANKRKYIEQNFYSVAGVMLQGWDLGVLGGGLKLWRGICDGAPATADLVTFKPLPQLKIGRSQASRL